MSDTSAHLADLRTAVDALDRDAARLERWAVQLAAALHTGGRLLAAGNGGSAAQAQHLVAELVGKLDRDRPPLSAIALSAETCGLTAIGNDYGFEQVFARQVTAHARPGDVVMLLSTSGGSPNVLAAFQAARASGAHVWAMTGSAPNPLAVLCDDALTVPSRDTQVVQEVHLVAIHLLCARIDVALAGLPFWDPVEEAATPAGVTA
jgi:D-sedoheptulose 7-phosphate isomerase